MQTVRKYLKRNPIQSGLAGCAIVVCLLNAGTISKALERNAQQREALGAASQSITQLQLAEQNRLKLAEIANARFDQGCELVYDSNDPTKYTPLIPGEGVLKGGYKPDPNLPPEAYMPAGGVFCDGYGNSGVTAIVPGKPYAVITDFASTQDRERIRKAIAGKTQKRPAPIQ